MCDIMAKLVQQLLKMKIQAWIWFLHGEKETKHFGLGHVVSSVRRVISVSDEMIRSCYPHMEVINIQLFPSDSSQEARWVCAISGGSKPPAAWFCLHPLLFVCLLAVSYLNVFFPETLNCLLG